MTRSLFSVTTLLIPRFDKFYIFHFQRGMKNPRTPKFAQKTSKI